jgi:outer membrane protein OmpA-like peptidoglycan-associated protein
LLLIACGGGAPSTHKAGDSKPAANEFQTQHSTTAGDAHGVKPSKIKATMSQAAMKFFVVDKESNDPVVGVVISLQAQGGKKYYTGETDALGYGEVLVPSGQSYEVVYLSLGKEKITAKVDVSDEPMQNIKLTLRYKPSVDKTVAALPPASGDDPEEAADAPAPVFRLEGVNFGSNSTDLQPESFERLDSVVEYLTYKPNSRIEISGHTDNVGPAKKNMALSEKRAQACRAYFIEKGIEGSRIEAVGLGDTRPVASNDSEEGRLKNRRIEAKELSNEASANDAE